MYKCHNCGVGRTLANFIKDQDSFLHDQYVMEKFKEGRTGKGTVTPNPKFNFSSPNFHGGDVNLEKISELNTSHEAREYLEKRGIKDLDYFYYCPKFKAWTLAPSAQMRYITIMLDEDKPKIFGQDRINAQEPVYIVEGPFDSTFIKNSVAMAGSDIDCRTFGWSDYIWIYDNEPRNREIVNRISNAINRGDKVVIWPNNIQQKDINDMYLSGHSVQNMVQSNVYQGLEANLRLNNWKKI